MASGGGPKPRKKSTARRPIGRGKAGSGKRLLHKAGAGKAALKTWRSAPKAWRKQQLANYSDRKGGASSLRAVVRKNRSVRRKAGKSPGSGKS